MSAVLAPDSSVATSPCANLCDVQTSDIALVLSALALLISLVIVIRYTLLSKKLTILQGGGDVTDFISAVDRQVAQVRDLRKEVEELRAELVTTRRELADAIRHVSVVRYDAFQDLAGRMSFSAAMLDDAGDGLVISALNGRSETRAYAKGVKGGIAVAGSFSPEEQEAVDKARGKNS